MPHVALWQGLCEQKSVGRAEPRDKVTPGTMG